MINILIESSHLLCSNTYAIEESRHAILIDVCESEQIYPHFLQKQILVDYILLTHEHYDHISGIHWWKKRFPSAILLCSGTCAEGIKNSKKNLSHYFDVFCEIQNWAPKQKNISHIDFIAEADESFQGQKIFSWMGHTLQLSESPGHSPGSTLIILDERYLFSGDTLLEKTPISTALYKSGKQDYEKITLPFLRSLSKELMIYPGHFRPFPISNAIF